ncbi:esterase FE4-like [Choristoneura fumiferana]|uniref:esterase FE4-like n=1 Tax=Choristoneura fumiferana TaxID=7141 RepID=UPI003D15BA90
MRTSKNIVLFTLIVMNFVDQPTPEVTIEQGTLSGRISANGLVFEYLGIPYATTNQSSRFKEPFPPPKWEGVFRATDDSTACPQDNFLVIRGTEDCLKINVFVPVYAERPLPVMVFVHGGAFFLGDGGKVFYGPQFLLNHDVILVTFNYRLGILGFLCLGIKEAPGNAGLKDQLAALRWVKRNIEAFGGDSNRITVFGVSAGAASISLLIASGKVDGIIHRAIIQSGSAVAHWSITRKPVWVASYVLKSLGHDTKDPHELYNILSKMSSRELAALPHEKPLEPYLDTQLIHLPCIEKPFPGTESLITDYPFNLFKKNPTNISIIHGTNSEEGLFFVAYDEEEGIKHRDGKFLMATDLEFETCEEAVNVSKVIHKFYFGDKRINTESIMELSELYKHIHFEMPSIIESEIISEVSSAPVYNYYFKYFGKRNYLKLSLGFDDSEGACHGDELLYIFDAMFWPFKIDDEDKLMIERMTGMWTNFAKYGDPTPEKTESLPIKWYPSSKGKIKFLHIDKNMSMENDMPSPEAYRMWKDIYTKYYRTKL